MKYLPHLLILFCIVLQSSVISYPFTLLAITIISIFSDGDITVLIFTAGMILDIFSIRNLGADSLYFLLVVHLGNRYRKKIHQGAFIYRFVYIIGPYLIYRMIFYKSLNFIIDLGTAISVGLILFWYGKFNPAKSKRRLEV